MDVFAGRREQVSLAAPLPTLLDGTNAGIHTAQPTLGTRTKGIHFETMADQNQQDTKSTAKGNFGFGFLRRGRGLSEATKAKVQELFSRIDTDGSNEINREEALRHFKGKFGKMSVEAMFSKTDLDDSKGISFDEFLEFWSQVRATGYSDEELGEELDLILEGDAWVGFVDKTKRRQRKIETKSAKNLPKRGF